MKKVLLKTMFLFITFLSLGTVSNVSAGSASLSIKGNDTVFVGDTIAVTVAVGNIQNIESGIATIQGTLSYDTAAFDYVSYENMSSLYGSYGANSKTFIILGMNGENIYKEQNILKIYLKAKKTGDATISLVNPIIGNRNEQVETAYISSKLLHIVEPVIETKVEPTKPVQAKVKQVTNTESVTQEKKEDSSQETSISTTEEKTNTDKQEQKDDKKEVKEVKEEKKKQKKENIIDSVVSFFTSLIDSIFA